MIGNLVKANRTLLCKVFRQSERWLSCQLCGTMNIYLQKTPLHCKNASNQVILPSLLTYEPRRQYSIGDYDKHVQAVNSGRGKGGARTRSRLKDSEGDFLKFGVSGMSWPGLNTSISESDPDRRYGKDGFDDRPKRTGTNFKFNPALRGWSGVKWPGRHAGTPQGLNGDIIEGFDSIVIELKKVSSTKASGRRRRVSAIVVVGNKKGAIGWAIGKGTLASGAIRKARNKAVNYLHYFPICDGHTIFHDLRTKVKSTEIIFQRKVPGYGVRCQRIIRAIVELSGIKDIRCKVVGRTTPLTVVICAFQGFQMQETHQELAERTGKNVVEIRPEKGNRPVVVAYPSQRAIKRRIQEESMCEVEDISIAFDPYRGAHRPKSLKDIQGTHPDLLADVHEVSSKLSQ